MKEHGRPIHIIIALSADEGVSLGQIMVESKSEQLNQVCSTVHIV